MPFPFDENDPASISSGASCRVRRWQRAENKPRDTIIANRSLG